MSHFWGSIQLTNIPSTAEWRPKVDIYFPSTCSPPTLACLRPFRAVGSKTAPAYIYIHINSIMAKTIQLIEPKQKKGPSFWVVGRVLNVPPFLMRHPIGFVSNVRADGHRWILFVPLITHQVPWGKKSTQGISKLWTNGEKSRAGHSEFRWDKQ